MIQESFKKFEEVRFQEDYLEVSKVFQGSFMKISKVLQRSSKVFKGIFRGYSVFTVPFKEVPGCSKKV